MKTYPRFPSALLSSLPPSRLVRFTSLSGHALPNPILLELYATIGRVLHASGLGQTIDKILRERESILYRPYLLDSLINRTYPIQPVDYIHTVY